MRERVSRSFFFAAFGAGGLAVLGTVWALQRGSPDFSVFFEAWKLVLKGQGLNVYHDTPDRYLYAPGFAWILAPLGFLPRAAAVWVWCLLKATSLGGALWVFGQFLGARSSAFWGCLFLARPLLIDFQYGQVNLLVLAAALWALSVYVETNASRTRKFLSWFCLAIAAVAKLYASPLLLVPFLSRPSLKLTPERLGAITGGLLLVLIPFLSLDWNGWIGMYRHWLEALLGRGMPMESHNQSFVAFLSHLLSGKPTHIVALYASRDYSIGWVWSALALQIAGWIWMLGWLGFLGYLIKRGPASDPTLWCATLVGITILPSHLIWKPYLIFGIPLAAVLIDRARGLRGLWPLLAIGAILNLTTIDIVGFEATARLESYAVMLWSYLAMLLVALAG